MTFPLSITLHNPTDQPIAGATVIISPETVNPTDSGTVLSTVRGTTDANGHLIFDLLPSTAGTYYIMHVNLGVTADIIAPFRFQMPPTATSYSALLTAAIASNQPIPKGVVVETNQQPLIDPVEAMLTDVDLVTGTTGDGWGAWSELSRYTNNLDEANITFFFAHMVFNPQWSTGANARAEVDIRVHHDRQDGTKVKDLVPNEYIYIRNSDQFVDAGSRSMGDLTVLQQGDYIIIEARARRQGNAAGMIRFVAAESSIDYAPTQAVSPRTVRISVDPTTMSGDGSKTNPIAPLIPYTQAEKDKLGAIPPDAAAPQTREQIRDKLESFTVEADKLDAQLALKNLPNPTIPDTLGDLTNVTVSNPQDLDAILYDSNASAFTNRQLPLPDGAQLVDSLQNRPPSQQLDRLYLRGQTTVEGGTQLPAPADVPNFTLFVRQSTSADNPGLYMTSATYDVPIRDRNRVILTPDSTGEFYLGVRGRVDDNYDNVIGQFLGRPIGGGRATLGLAIHFGSDTPVTTAPATLYVRGINGDNTVRAIPRATSSQHPSGTTTTIQGKVYAEYYDVVSTSAVDQLDETAQTLTFFTNAAGSLPLNLKPATEHKSRVWHLQSPVPPDWNITDPLSPAFIKNKPVPTTIGRVIAETAALPSGADVPFNRRGTTQVSVYLPQLSAGAVTTGYTVTANTVNSAQPHPDNMFGWYLRAVDASSEICRVFIPLTSVITYSSLSSIVDKQRVVSHAFMGVYNSNNYYLAYQSEMGDQATTTGAGSTGHSIEVFIATPHPVSVVRFNPNVKIQLVEAVI